MSLVEPIVQRVRNRGICFVIYPQRTDAVRQLFLATHNALEQEMRVYPYTSGHESVLSQFLTWVSLEHNVSIVTNQPLGRRLLSLQGKLPGKVLLSFERSQGQEAELAAILSDCVDHRRYRTGWFHLLVGMTPEARATLVRLDPRLERRFFYGNDFTVDMEAQPWGM